MPSRITKRGILTVEEVLAAKTAARKHALPMEAGVDALHKAFADFHRNYAEVATEAIDARIVGKFLSTDKPKKPRLT